MRGKAASELCGLAVSSMGQVAHKILKSLIAQVHSVFAEIGDRDIHLIPQRLLPASQVTRQMVQELLWDGRRHGGGSGDRWLLSLPWAGLHKKQRRLSGPGSIAPSCGKSWDKAWLERRLWLCVETDPTKPWRACSYGCFSLLWLCVCFYFILLFKGRIRIL